MAERGNRMNKYEQMRKAHENIVADKVKVHEAYKNAIRDLSEAEERNRRDYFNEIQRDIHEATKDGRTLSAQQVSDLLGGELSPQSIRMYGSAAANGLNVNPSMPLLCRTYKTKNHHFVELDDNGEVVETLDITTGRLEYYVD